MSSIKATARRAGALYFLFLILGLVDMYGFAHFLVPADATATARNIKAAELTYRIGILTDFVTLLLFLFLVVSLYNLLKGADKWQATLMVWKHCRHGILGSLALSVRHPCHQVGLLSAGSGHLADGCRLRPPDE
jgi:hypothetical protein